jgi:L-seryl-tRNA(Ser) seleniumtransferase
MPSSILRSIPSVDRLLREPTVALLVERYARGPVLEGARRLLLEWRERVRVDPAVMVPPAAALAEQLAEQLSRSTQPPLRRAINATGVVLHTNLGRAPLSAAALAAMADVGRGYSNLEYDLDAGARGSRHEHVSAALNRLSGTEAALVVNNNAAAILLALTALAQHREVVIARSQLVEIGGGFRIPDVLRQSGARLVEVGTTNRTYARDYTEACNSETALLLRVHSSNFRVIGFVHEPSLAELADVAHARGLPLVDDLGSGSLLDSSAFGLAREPQVQASVVAGADLIAFSGDKLLGGPQCGILVGRERLVAQLKRHPLTRAVRPDKTTLAALGATLEHYLRGEAVQQVPVWRMISADPGEIEARARVVGAALGSGPLRWEIIDGFSTIGGGSLPGETLPTRLLALDGSLAPHLLAARLRSGKLPVIARVERGRLVLDLRTVLPEEDGVLAEALREG